MSRASLLVLLSLALAAPVGCGKEREGTVHPDEASALKELEAIPARIQAEVDLVLQPIHDVDVVIDQVSSMPEALGVDAASLRRLTTASLETGEVAVSPDVPADARAEVEAVLVKIHGLATRLEETPARVESASADLAAIATKATDLVSALTTRYRTALSDSRLDAAAKARMKADLATVLALDAEIQATLSQARHAMVSLPSRGKDALAQLTVALSGTASTAAGRESLTNVSGSPSLALGVGLVPSG